MNGKLAFQPNDRADQYLAYRLRVLPDQLDLARRKVAALENEARRLGFVELLAPAPSADGQ